MTVGAVEPEQPAEPAPLEDGDDDAVGAADRQQVHHRRLQRHGDGPEHDHQQQERTTTRIAPMNSGSVSLELLVEVEGAARSCPVT